VTYLHHLQKQLRQAQQLNESHADKLTASNEEEQASLIYASPPMHKLYEKIKQVAPFPTNILITGPSGTGKEVLAGMIHQLSSSDKKTFIKVNCGAIPAELFESEIDRKSTRLNSSHVKISYAVFCLQKKSDHKTQQI